MTTFTLPDEIAFDVSGSSFNMPTTNLTSDMIQRAFVHGLRQYIGDAAAGKEGDEAKRAAREAAYAARGDWMRSEARTRAGLPAAESMFLAEARLWLRARGVGTKITAALKTRDEAVEEINTVVLAALKAKGRQSEPVAPVRDAVVAKIEETVKLRLATAADFDI